MFRSKAGPAVVAAASMFVLSACGTPSGKAATDAKASAGVPSSATTTARETLSRAAATTRRATYKVSIKDSALSLVGTIDPATKSEQFVFEGSSDGTNVKVHVMTVGTEHFVKLEAGGDAAPWMTYDASKTAKGTFAMLRNLSTGMIELLERVSRPPKRLAACHTRPPSISRNRPPSCKTTS